MSISQSICRTTSFPVYGRGYHRPQKGCERLIFPANTSPGRAVFLTLAGATKIGVEAWSRTPGFGRGRCGRAVLLTLAGAAEVGVAPGSRPGGRAYFLPFTGATEVGVATGSRAGCCRCRGSGRRRACGRGGARRLGGGCLRDGAGARLRSLG